MGKNNLLSTEQVKYAVAVAAQDFPFNKQVALSSSVNFHTHVPDVQNLPHHLLIEHNIQFVNKVAGYVKYVFDGGVNFIFSDIPVAQKEKCNVASNKFILIILV